MGGLLLKSKQISSLQLRLQKHKKYDLKKNPFVQYGGAVGSKSQNFTLKFYTPTNAAPHRDSVVSVQYVRTPTKSLSKI